MSSSDFDAFDSPNFPPIATVGIEIDINWADIVRPTSLRAFKAHKDMCPNVATLRLFPGITAATVRAFLSPPVQGVVLETFGAGNAPQRADLMTALKEACDRGVVIVAISQCAKGSVSDAYETGRALQAVGVASGGDMTTECALAKLAYLLSKSDRISIAQIHSLMQAPLRGELTLPVSSSITSPPVTGPLTNDINSPEAFGNLLNHIARLSVSSLVPSLRVVSPPAPHHHAPVDPHHLHQEGHGASNRPKPAHSLTLLGSTVALSKSARETTSSWMSTASETASAEAALYPFLVHLAVARDDVETLNFCLGRQSPESAADTGTSAVQSPVVAVEGEIGGGVESFPISNNTNRNLVKGGI
ncbi:hypothetical protein FRC17_006982, partial [Serendipita sp. 399]